MGLQNKMVSVFLYFERLPYCLPYWLYKQGVLSTAYKKLLSQTLPETYLFQLKINNLMNVGI